MLSSTLPIPLLSPPSSISDLHHPRCSRDQDYGIAKMATWWTKTMDNELWPPGEQRLWIMNCGHLMNKEYGLWIMATWWTRPTLLPISSSSLSPNRLHRWPNSDKWLTNSKFPTRWFEDLPFCLVNPSTSSPCLFFRLLWWRRFRLQIQKRVLLFL